MVPIGCISREMNGVNNILKKMNGVVKSKNMYVIQLIIVVTLAFSWKFELGDLLSFVGSIIGVLGAYYIFDMGRRKEIEAKRDTLYMLLDYTIESTMHILDGHIGDEVDEFCNLYISKYEIIDDGWSIDDIICIYEEDVINVDIRKEFRDRAFVFYGVLGEHERDMLSFYIYDSNWSSYIPYVINEDRQRIVNWFTYLSSAKIGKELINDYDEEWFIDERDFAIECLNRYYDSVGKHEYKKESSKDVTKRYIKEKLKSRKFNV